jgi:uncharacterized protein YehS (DUF1456 family)
MKSDYEPLWKWATIREQARVRKEQGYPFPWVKSKIISTYRFCNVRREDDRVTVWIRKNIREQFPDHDALWFMLCLARVINWPPTLQELLDTDQGWPDQRSFSLSVLADVLESRAKRGEKVFTGAYTITAPPTKGQSKASYVALHTLGGLWAERDRFTQLFDDEDVRLKDTHRLLKRFPCWGDFMAYQAVVDMRFTSLLNRAPDRKKWAAAGPGTIRGLNRLWGRELTFKLKQEDALDEMREIYELSIPELSFPIDFSDVPNMLCETDKYLRVLNGEGTPRAKYVPGRGY